MQFKDGFIQSARCSIKSFAATCKIFSKYQFRLNLIWVLKRFFYENIIFQTFESKKIQILAACETFTTIEFLWQRKKKMIIVVRNHTFIATLFGQVKLEYVVHFKAQRENSNRQPF